MFDPTKTSYAKLLDLFWHGIDPTQGDGQFCDRGKQYRSVVFVVDARQRKLAEESKRAIEVSGVLHAPIVTQILPATRFWPAEDFHQDFWKKDPIRYRSYRLGCGRDRPVRAPWGGKASGALRHSRPRPALRRQRPDAARALPLAPGRSGAAPNAPRSPLRPSPRAPGRRRTRAR